MAAHPRKTPAESARPIDRLLSPLHNFLHIEAAGGILLLVGTVIALIWANSPWADAYDHLWHLGLTFGFGSYALDMTLHHFVNDGLMAIFFFVVGLEIKREMIAGELASRRKAAIPIAAAIGGMVVPAAIYFAINPSGDDVDGWAIPMATDIAFAIGIMALLGKRVPLSLKIFLTALAIVDDLGAVMVIALFYTSDLSFVALGVSGGFLVLSIVANRLGIRTPLIYALLGIGVWVMLLKSGVHATIGGVLLALTLPAKVRINPRRFLNFSREAIEEYESAGDDGDDILTNTHRQTVVAGLEQACEDVQTPLNRLERGLHPWVAWLIMPVFALANAGVPLGAEAAESVGSGTALGVILGLVVGKPVGVVVATWIATSTGLGDLPEGTNWKQILAAGCLAGIGFTMSLFIANLAFGDSPLLQMAKIGILAGSFVSGVAGLLLLRAGTTPPDAT